MYLMNSTMPVINTVHVLDCFLYFVYSIGELLGALCVRKGSCIYVACQEEILKNVGDNLERRLPDPIDVAEGLVQKLTSENHGAGDDLVSVRW